MLKIYSQQISKRVLLTLWPCCTIHHQNLFVLYSLTIYSFPPFFSLWQPSFYCFWIQLHFFFLSPLPCFFKGSTYKWFISVQVMSLWDPMDCSTPDFPVPYRLLEFAQVHIHCISDALQPSHPLLPSFSFFSQSFPASGSFPMSWLFVSGVSSIGVSASASVFPMNIQGWFPLRLTNLIALLFWELSRVFSAPQFKSINSSVLSILYGTPHNCRWLLERL